MDKEKNTRLPLVDLIEVKPMQDGYRWVAITAMLFAIGIILHTVSPNVGGVTPNWTIAMYSIVINLTNPTLSQAVGIGFIAGITLVPSSKSAFPLGNIASELSGAITCCILVKAMLRCGLGKWKLRPLVTGFLATMASGGVFTFILKIVLAAACLAVCHAAGGGDRGRAERHDHLFAVRAGAEAVFCAGGR